MGVQSTYSETHRSPQRKGTREVGGFKPKWFVFGIVIRAVPPSVYQADDLTYYEVLRRKR